MPIKTNFQNSPAFFVFLFTIFLASAQRMDGQVSPKIDSLLRVLEKQDPDERSIEILSKIAMQYAEIDPTEGLKYAVEAKSLATHRGTRLDLALANNAVASNWLMMSEVDSAMVYYKTAMSLYQEIGDKKGMARVAGNIGHANYYTGQHDDALQYYFQALSLFEEIGDEDGITNEHASLGIAYMAQQKYPEAIYHDSIALVGFREARDSSGWAMVLGNLANIYSDTREFDKAVEYFRQAADILGRINDPLGKGRTLVNLAAMYVDMHQYQLALESALKALKICNQNNLNLCSQYCYSNIGLSYLESYMRSDSITEGVVLVPGDPKMLLNNAIINLENAAKLTDKLESPKDFEGTHRALSLAYKFNGQFEKALQHHEIYSMMKDSLSSVERAGRIEELTTEREIAVRDKQIELDKLQLKIKRNERIYFIIGLALLGGWLVLVYRNAVNQKKSNHQLGLLNTQISTANLQLGERNDKLALTLEELKAAQAQLIESERQKENEILRRQISRDIHDDISSGLSKISWMTEILRSNPNQHEPTDSDLLSRIASYSRETVSKLGEIIWSTKPENDNFSGMVSYCREFLNKYLNGLPIRSHIDLQEDSHNTSMNPELRRNLYLVLKEAVHNAVKYSKATELNVSMHEQDGAYSIFVEDNGIGMDINGNSPNGNGFRNMQGRMKDVNGTMAVHSAPGKGTRIEFTGPVY